MLALYNDFLPLSIQQDRISSVSVLRYQLLFTHLYLQMASGTPKGSIVKRNQSTSAVAKKAARNAMLKVAGTTKVSATQLERVVQSVNDATKRLSQPDSILSTSTTTKSSKRKSRDTVGPWKLGKTLGKGSSGRVRLAKNMETGQLAAIKIVPKKTNLQSKNDVSSTLSASYSSNASTMLNTTANNYNNAGHSTVASNPYGIEREIVIMKLISHPNVLGLYEVWENKAELYLVLEYVDGGELFDYLVSKGRLCEREAVHYFKQIIQGVSYCHSFNICHRDLKPENLLLDKKNKTIKIADFGMAALEVSNKLLQTSCGSPHYASPEIVMGKSYHGGPSDVWSCGIILFALLTGHLPFNDDNIKKLLLKVQSGKYQMPQNLSSEAQDLISKILVINPARRLTTEEILAHPLIVKYDSTMKSKKFRASGNYMAHGKSNSDLHLLNSYEDKTLSLTCKKDIDESTLNNLQILWHGASRELIVAKLLQSTMSEEKIFYTLLLQYKENHMKKQEVNKMQPEEQSFDAHTEESNDDGSHEDTGAPKLIQKSQFSVPMIKQEENDAVVASLPSNSLPPAIPVFTASTSRTFKKSASALSLQSQRSLSRRAPPRSSSRKTLSRSNSKKTLQNSASKRSLYSSTSISKRSVNLNDYVALENEMESNQLPPLPSLDSTSGFEYLCEQLLFGNALDKILEEEEEDDGKGFSKANVTNGSSNSTLKAQLGGDNFSAVQESFKPSFIFNSEPVASLEQLGPLGNTPPKKQSKNMPLQDITNTFEKSRAHQSKLKRDVSQKSNLSQILGQETSKREYNLPANANMGTLAQHPPRIHSLDPRRNASQPAPSSAVASILKSFRSTSAGTSENHVGNGTDFPRSALAGQNAACFTSSFVEHEEHEGHSSTQGSYEDSTTDSFEPHFLAHSSAVQKERSSLSSISFNASTTFKDLSAYLQGTNNSYIPHRKKSLKPPSRNSTIKKDPSRINLAGNKGTDRLSTKAPHSHNCSIVSNDADLISDMSFAMEIPTKTFMAQAITISNRGSAEHVVAEHGNHDMEIEKQESTNIQSYTPATTHDENGVNIFEDPPVESDSMEVTSSESDSSPNVHRKAVSIDTLNTINVLPPTTNVRVSLYGNNNLNSTAALPRETTEQILSKFKLSPEKSVAPAIQKRFSHIANHRDLEASQKSQSKLAMFEDLDEDDEAQEFKQNDEPSSSTKDIISTSKDTQPNRVTMLFDGEETEHGIPAHSEPMTDDKGLTTPHDRETKSVNLVKNIRDTSTEKPGIKPKVPSHCDVSSSTSKPKQSWISKIFGGFKQKSSDQKFVKRHVTFISFDDAHMLTLNEFDKNAVDYQLKSSERRKGKEKVEYDCKFTSGNFKFKIKIETANSTIITVRRKGRNQGQHSAAVFEIFNGDVAKVIKQAERKVASN